jgi:hypothetical protein
VHIGDSSSGVDNHGNYGSGSSGGSVLGYSLVHVLVWLSGRGRSNRSSSRRSRVLGGVLLLGGRWRDCTLNRSTISRGRGVDGSGGSLAIGNRVLGTWVGSFGLLGGGDSSVGLRVNRVGGLGRALGSTLGRTLGLLRRNRSLSLRVLALRIGRGLGLRGRLRGSLRASSTGRLSALWSSALGLLSVARAINVDDRVSGRSGREGCRGGISGLAVVSLNGHGDRSVEFGVLVYRILGRSTCNGGGGSHGG